MGQFGKTLANVATGGLSGMLLNRNPLSIASGGFLGGRKKVAPQAQIDPNAQAFYDTQTPEEKANIEASWKGAPDRGQMMNQWYTNAGSPGVPAPAPPQAMETAGGVQPGQISGMLQKRWAPQGGVTAGQALTTGQPWGRGGAGQAVAPGPAQAPAVAGPRKLSYEEWKAQGRPNVPHEG